MKTFLVLCAAAGLSGCAVYPAPAYDAYGNAVPTPYIVEQQPTYIYGSGGVYRSGGYLQVYPGDYHRSYPGGYYRRAPPPVIVVPQPGPQGTYIRPRPGRGNGDRDRDGDGIRNRFDRDRNNDGIPDRIGRNRDRDGDGIPNRRDPHPNIPNHRQ